MRLKFLPQGVLPILLGTLVAWSRSSIFDPSHFILAVLGAALVQIALTMLNDTLDFRYGADLSPTSRKNPFSGGSGVLADGRLTPKETMALVIALYTGAALIGAYLTWQVGLGVFWIALVGLFLSVAYSAKPIWLASRGLGELAMLIGYGPTLTLGAAYLQQGSYDLLAGVAGLLPGMLMVAMIIVNEIPDHHEDLRAGKLNLTVRLGPHNARWLYLAALLAVYAFIFVAALARLFPLWTLLGMGSLPLALHSLRTVLQAFRNPLEVAGANRAMVLTYSLTMLLFCLGLVLGAGP